jgi:hypothetical protein
VALLLGNGARAKFVRVFFARDCRAAPRVSHHNGERAHARTPLVKIFQRPLPRRSREVFGCAKSSQLRDFLPKNESS